MRKLSEIELSILAAVLQHSVANPKTTDAEKSVLTEMLTLINDLILKWDNAKGQKLWGLSSNKTLVESPEFVADSNGSKCVIKFALDKLSSVIMTAVNAALTGAAGAAPVNATATQALTTEPAAAEVMEPLPGTPEFAEAMARERQLRKDGAKRTLWGNPIPE